jgi:hypothetical protein
MKIKMRRRRAFESIFWFSPSYFKLTFLAVTLSSECQGAKAPAEIQPVFIAAMSDVLVIDCDTSDQAEMRAWEKEATGAIRQGTTTGAPPGNNDRARK